MGKSKAIGIEKKARLFIGAQVPDEGKSLIKEKLQGYTRYTKKILPEESWHVTFIFIGEVESYQQYLEAMLEPLAQTYLPTISLTHIGRGRQKGQLWAYGRSTKLLEGLREQLKSRLDKLRVGYAGDMGNEEFVPHIRLADLREGSFNNLLPDVPLAVVWQIKEINIYRSELTYKGASYAIEGKIKLT